MLKTNKGFTIMELLVAMAVASTLLGMVYAVYIRSAKVYRSQGMQLEMQQRARFALDHLRRDVANAGFNSSVNYEIDPNRCPGIGGLTVARALTIAATSQDQSVILPGVNKNMSSTTFTLFGDYAGKGRIFYTKAVMGSSIVISDDPVPDPANPLNTLTFEQQVSEAEWNHMFNAGSKRRVLRILDKNSYEILMPVASADYATRTILVDGSPPQMSGTQGCGIQGFGEGLQVNSAMFLQYRVAVTNVSLGTTALIRQEVDVDGNLVDGTQLVIADNVVEVNAYDWAFDESIDLRAPGAFTFYPTTDTQVLARLSAVGSQVHNLRYLTLAVSVRAMDEDPDLVYLERVPNRMIRTYDVDNTLSGSARVMTVSAKIGLNNLALRAVRQ